MEGVLSATALQEYQRARNSQLTRNDARRIRTRVEASQQNPVASSRRWPFELMQNAHDAGPRAADERVDVVFQLQDHNLVISHTGKPFTAQELAALLSGGSSKEFDDLETTGRFGTGFLATHTLSTRVTVDGVITTEDGPEHFIVELNRSGDEGRIPDFPVTRSHPPASWPSAANSSICRTYRKTAGEESRRRSPVANRWMRP